MPVIFANRNYIGYFFCSCSEPAADEHRLTKMTAQALKHSQKKISLPKKRAHRSAGVGDSDQLGDCDKAVAVGLECFDQSGQHLSGTRVDIVKKHDAARAY